MAAWPGTFGVAEQQILLDFSNDESGPFRRRRLLLLTPGGPSEWIAASPDREDEIVSISTHRVLPLRRHAPFPARVRDQIYAFDSTTGVELCTLNLEARALAPVLAPEGGVVVPTGDVSWLVADTASEEFGNEVPDSEMTVPSQRRGEGAENIERLDDDWVVVEKTMRPDIGIWEDEKCAGPGRDARMSTTTRDARRRRYTGLATAITELKDVPLDDCVPGGPRATKEELGAIHASGQGALGDPEFWINTSGVTPDHSFVRLHRDVPGIVFLAQQVDRLDVYNCACVELAARQPLREQKAVKQNPRNPDFRGLCMMTRHRLDNTSDIVTDEYARWLTVERKSEAFTLQQQRLHRVEATHENAMATDHSLPGGGGGGGGRGRGRERGSGGGDGGKAADVE